MISKYTTVELYKPNKWGVMSKGENLSTYEVTHLLNELSLENEKLKKLLDLISESWSFNERDSVKEILRDTIQSADCAAEYSHNAFNDYIILSEFFEEKYNEHWDNYD